MAQININLGTPPSGQDGDPVRTAFEKTQTMFTELYKGNALANNSGWGGTAPPTMPTGYDVNDLTGTRVVLINEGVNLPASNSPYWFVETLDNGGGYRTQRAARFTSPGVFVRQRHASTGWTPWRQQIDTSTFTAGGETADANAIRVDGFYATRSQWTGSPFAGLDGLNQGMLVHQSWTAGQPYAVQTFSSLNITVGRRWVREFLAGTWQPWKRVYDSSTLTDPVNGTSNTGIMESVAAGGMLVNRYVNGEVNIRGTAPLTPTIGANAITAFTVNLPISLVNGAFGFAFSCTENCQPQQGYDMYGIVARNLNTPSTVQMLIRNGATPQTFQISFSVWGRWK